MRGCRWPWPITEECENLQSDMEAPPNLADALCQIWIGGGQSESGRGVGSAEAGVRKEEKEQGRVARHRHCGSAMDMNSAIH
jgi:hypothetical protein